MALFDEKDGGGVGGGAADSDSGIETPVMKFIFFWSMEKLAWNCTHGARKCFFPTNVDLANVLGMMN